MVYYVLAMGKQQLGPHVVVGYGIKIFWPGLFITSPDHLDGKGKMPVKSDIQLTFLQVYPAALRAQKRRQQEIKKKAQLREEAVKKKEVPSHFDVDVAFPKTWWMTEYQRNFCKEEDVKRHFLRQHASVVCIGKCVLP